MEAHLTHPVSEYQGTTVVWNLTWIEVPPQTSCEAWFRACQLCLYQVFWPKHWCTVAKSQTSIMSWKEGYIPWQRYYSPMNFGLQGSGELHPRQIGGILWGNICTLWQWAAVRGSAHSGQQCQVRPLLCYLTHPPQLCQHREKVQGNLNWNK